MKLKKSKKGSGLILVIMMFAFLSIVGMAFISMSLSSYKLRIVKSNAKTGLYGAESGIDEAYGIIGNKVDESIKKGNEEVDTFMDKLSEDLINAKKEIYELEKKNNYNSLSENDVKGIMDKIEEGKNYRYLGDIKDCIQVEKYTLKKDKQQKQYVRLYLDDSKVLESQNKIFKDTYTENILQGNEDKPLNILKEISNCTFNINKEKPKIDAKILINKEEYSNFKEVNDNLNKIKENKKIPIRISSKFKYKGATKQIKADYIINIPPYNKSYYVKEDNQIVYKNPVFTKAISIDGNMNIDGKVDIDGDIFVAGNDEKKDKEKGKDKQEEDKGIIIKGAESNFEGNVVTNKDFKMKESGSKCTVIGNIFANNVLLDKSARGSKLYVNKKNKDKPGNVYTQDDLEIDAPSSITKLQGAYYGLNNGDKSTEAGSSSSININAVENGKANCELDIEGKGSIIMGTAYADFEKDHKKYQTGESVAIKGNYKAYSIPSNTNPLSEYIFDYYNPTIDKKKTDLLVGLISRKYIKNSNSNEPETKELNAFEKSEYFEDIVKSKDYKDIFKLGKIDINGVDCVHLGAIYNYDKKEEDKFEVNKSSNNFSMDELKRVYEKIQEFNTQVYNMGEKIDDIELLSSSKKSLKTQLNKIDNITEIDGENGVVVIKGKTKPEGEKETIEVSDKKLKFQDNSEIKLYTEGKKKGDNTVDIKNALIIVDGNLKIKGNLNFTGALIVTGNLEIESGGSLDIKYDENVVRNLISKNYGKLKNVFTNNSEEIFDTLNKTQFDMDGHADTVLNNLIQMKNWKIIK